MTIPRMMSLRSIDLRITGKGSKAKLFILLLFILPFFSFLFFCGGSEKGSETSSKSLQQRPDVGYLAPDFSLEVMRTGRVVNLSDYRGSVVLLNFWASWCFPCRKEMPSMEELYRIFGKANFAILAVNLDKFGGEKVSGFVSNYGLTFPILLDRGLRTALRYEVRHIPTTYLIDKNGIIKEKIVGGRNWTEPAFVKKIETLMGS